MVRTFALGLVLSLVGPQPEALAQRMWARLQQDRAYDVCIASAGDDDWMCEEILEGWPANRAAEQVR